MNINIVNSPEHIFFNNYDTKDSPLYLFTTHPVRRILPIKIHKGMEWEDKGKSSGIPVKATSTIYSTDEIVEVPAKKFQSCVEVRTVFEIPKSPELTPYKTKSVWWKEGVGPVRIKVDIEDFDQCIGELVDFKVANNIGFWPMSKGNYWVYRWKLSRENNSFNIFNMNTSFHEVDF